MIIEFSKSFEADILAVLVDEGDVMPKPHGAFDADVMELAEAARNGSRFSGKTGQVLEIAAPKGASARRYALVGGGKANKRDDRALEKAGASLVKHFLTSGYSSIAVQAGDAASTARAALGARLAGYRFDTYRTRLKDEQKPSVTKVTFVVDDIEAAKAAWAPFDAAASGTELARDLMCEPPNILNPESYAKRIEGFSEFGLEVKVLGEAEMTKLGMHSLLGVGMGSERESKLAIMFWNGAGDDSAPLALVGKGVCFDSGGISLKPGPGMEDMKGDMGGSAAVCGAMKTLALRKAKVNVVGLVGLVENMPDGKALRPGDIVTSASGQTIEIQNTDAEGRLVLADVLWYAQEHYKPKAMIDLATLTGAIVVTLGHEHAGVFSNDDDLAEGLRVAGLAEGETVWRLPLGPEYDKLINSKFADMKNIGGKGAGSITAAQFLKRFVKDDLPWAHIDIAGTAWKDGEKDAMDPAWASGYGPRLLDRYIKDRYKS